MLETAAAKKENVGIGLLKTFLGQKKSNPTPQEQKMENFQNIKIFMRSMMLLLQPVFLDELENYYKKNGIMEPLDEKLLATCRNARMKKED